MKKIALPVLDETASVDQGWHALRRHRVRAVVTRSGNALWLHEDSDLAEAVGEQKGLALRQTKKRMIAALGPHSSEMEIREFLQRNPGEHLVSAAIGQGPASEFMHFSVRPESPLAEVEVFFVRPENPLAEVDVTAYYCPDDPNEVSTKPKFCNLHQKHYVVDD
jgi:hypothetical protein